MKSTSIFMKPTQKLNFLHLRRLNSVARDDSTSVGQTMNLVSNDVERFLLTTLFGSYIFWAPIQAIIIIAVGTYMTGPAFALGVGLLLFFFIPLQLYLSKGFASVRSKVCSACFERYLFTMIYHNCFLIFLSYY